MTSRCQHGLPSSDWGHRLSHGPHLTGRATAGSSPTLDGHWIGPALGRDGSLSATCPSCHSEAAQGLHCTRPCAEDELPCPELSLDLSAGRGDPRPSAELAQAYGASGGFRPVWLPGPGLLPRHPGDPGCGQPRAWEEVASAYQPLERTRGPRSRGHDAPKLGRGGAAGSLRPPSLRPDARPTPWVREPTAWAGCRGRLLADSGRQARKGKRKGRRGAAEAVGEQDPRKGSRLSRLP